MPGQRRPRQRDAEPVGGCVEHQIVVLEATVLRARAVIHALRGEPGTPGRSVGIVDQWKFEQPGRVAMADLARKFR